MGLAGIRFALAAVFTLFAVNPAFSLVIDSFEGNLVATSTGTIKIAYAAAAVPSAIGGTRSFRTEIVAGPSKLELESFAGNLWHSQNSGVSGKSLAMWDGDADPGVFNPAGLGGIDLTQDGGTAVKLQIVSFDYAFQRSVNLTVTVFDASDAGGGKYSSRTVTLSEALTNYLLEIPFTSFDSSGPLGPVEWSNVGAVTLLINGSNPDVDLTIDEVGTNGGCPLAPGISGRVVDDCGVCGGSNEGKDRCGVCGGDGQSCLQCETINLSVEAEQAAVKARKLYANNKSIVSKLCAAESKFKKTAARDATKLLREILRVKGLIPATIKRCSNEEFCMDVDLNGAALSQMRRRVQELYRLFKTAAAKVEKCWRGGTCGGAASALHAATNSRAAALAASARDCGDCEERVIQRLKDLSKLKKLQRLSYEETIGVISSLPTLGSQCS